MTQEFNQLPWHDAELKEISINRDQKDNVQILVRWPEGYDSQDATIEFTGCYALQATMNFGIIPPDFILDAECISQSNELDEIKNSWLKMGLELADLHCYRIMTNSTNSSINIFAQGFRLIGVDLSK